MKENQVATISHKWRRFIRNQSQCCAKSKKQKTERSKLQLASLGRESNCVGGKIRGLNIELYDMNGVAVNAKILRVWL